VTTTSLLEKEMLAWIKRLLMPDWFSGKLKRFEDASSSRSLLKGPKHQDFLEKYYEEQANNELLPRD
jgi:hypothetical protein